MPRFQPAINHLALFARDLPALAHFYGQTLQLSELARRFGTAGELRAVWFNLGPSVLMLELADAQAASAAPSLPPAMRPAGAFLLAINVDDRQRQRLLAALADAGVALLRQSEYSDYFLDPEGNRLALSRFEIATFLEAEGE
ncbi:MAG: VOC family protein [Leptospirales bacterium]|nr:VOC family protein [Leptospirales bacterium]